jgi:membrane associated rhomboid family serine protease
MWNYGESFGVSTRFMAENFLISWRHLEDGRYWTLITSAFSHNSLLHIVLNMFVLNSFGPIVQYTLGTKRFLGFYLAASVASSLAHSYVSKYIVGDGDIPALGASGAISGIVLLFSLFYPKQKILMFGFIPVPAILGAIAFVGLDIWGVYAQSHGGGLPIGHGAHLGGALAGFVYFLILLRKRRRLSPAGDSTL